MYRFVITNLLAASGTEHSIDLDREVVLVGRRSGVDVPLPHPEVGGVHLRVEREGSAVVLVDGGAPSGTKVGGELLAPGARRRLEDGDVVIVAGVFRLRYQARVSGTAEATPEKTAELARSMVRDVLASLGQSDPDAGPTLVVVAGPATGRRVALPLPERDVVVGRDESCELAIDDDDLSREHLRVHRTWAGATVAELGSKNGTRVEGALLVVGVSRALVHGDEIIAGRTHLRYEDPTGDYLRRVTVELPQPTASPTAPPVPAAPLQAASFPWLAVGVALLAIAAAAWLLRLVIAG